MMHRVSMAPSLAADRVPMTAAAMRASSTMPSRRFRRSLSPGEFLVHYDGMGLPESVGGCEDVVVVAGDFLEEAWKVPAGSGDVIGSTSTRPREAAGK